MRGTRVSTIVLKFKRATGELGTVLDRRGRAAVLKYLSDRDHLSRLRNEIRERYLAKEKGGGEENRGIYAENAAGGDYILESRLLGTLGQNEKLAVLFNRTFIFEANCE